MLREQMGLTQSKLAKKLDISRSSVNNWEMGLTSPSTKIIIELANTFDVSTDYLLGIDKQSVLYVDGLNDEEIASLLSIINVIKKANRTKISE